MTVPTKKKPLLCLYPPDEEDKRSVEDKETDTLLALTRLASPREKEGVDLRYVERVIFIKEITGGMCASFLFVTVILFVYAVTERACDTKEAFLCLVLLLFSYTAGKQNRSKAQIQAALLDRLRNTNSPTEIT